jgi:hypothetical protein
MKASKLCQVQRRLSASLMMIEGKFGNFKSFGFVFFEKNIPQ